MLTNPSGGSLIVERFQGLLGVILILGIVVALSKHRGRINWRIIGSALALQAVAGFLVIKWEPGAALPGRPPRSTVNDTAVAPPPRSETATSTSPLAAATLTAPLEEKVTAGDQPSR